MSYTPPARAAFPGSNPEAIAAGTAVTDGTIGDLVKSQAWQNAHHGRMHCSDFWPTAGDGVCLGVDDATELLDYDIKPRSGMRQLEFRCRTWSSNTAADCYVKIECMETGQTVTETLAAGAAYRYGTETLQIDREDQWTQIRVYCWAASGDVYLTSFALWDRDLQDSECHPDYYATTTTAAADSLVRYWALQEDDDAGTDATAADTMASGDDLVAHNGVTIDSALINGHRKYHRVFGTTDYLSGSYAAANGDPWTVLVEVEDRNTAARHTYLSLGEAGASGGVAVGGIYTTSYQVGLEVGATRGYWPITAPMTEIETFFLVHDPAAPSVTLYTADGEGTVTQRIQVAASPTCASPSLRLGAGIGTAGYFDAYYELDDGDIRQAAIWERALSLMEMNAIARHIRTRGALLVR